VNLEKKAHRVDDIREKLEEYIGQTLAIRVNLGRSKIVEDEGTLVEVHPSLFIMELNRKRGRKARQSYQYVDVLTRIVLLTQDGQDLFPELDDDDEEEESGDYLQSGAESGEEPEQTAEDILANLKDTDLIG